MIPVKIESTAKHFEPSEVNRFDKKSGERKSRNGI